jgi:hypothetical protein
MHASDVLRRPPNWAYELGLYEDVELDHFSCDLEIAPENRDKGLP